jgi:3-hydroxybutyryl-CoA dehydrogenase
MNQIGILGAGLMGHGLAQVFAAAGCQVTVFDHNPGTLSSLKNRVRQNLDVFEQEALVSKEAADLCLDRIVLSDSLAAMCRGRNFILEAISENMAAKRLVFSEMESHVPPATILASNTSAIRITEIARGLRYPQRVLGTHFWNPPHIVPCVEVVKAAETSNASFEAAFRLMEKVGKIPVRVLKDIPGFLGNRMQHALWREAFSLVEQGIASAEDVDKVVRNAFGLRLAFLGPLETADLAGLDLTHHIQQDLLPRLEASPTPSALLKEKIDRGRLGAKSGEGFHRWPAEKLKRLIERRDRILLGIANLVRSG